MLIIILPVVIADGTLTDNCVADAERTVADTPLMETTFSEITELKFVPMIVITVPAIPLSGVKLVMEGISSNVHSLKCSVSVVIVLLAKSISDVGITCHVSSSFLKAMAMRDGGVSAAS